MSFEIKCEYCGSKVDTQPELINTPIHCQTCGEQLVVPLTNFTAGMVCGNYWIQRRVGSGNISEVFLAKRLADNEKVYLKVLTPAVTPVHAQVEQFMIETCRAHQIQNPNVISVFETGKINGHYYLASPCVEGECLDQRILRTGPMGEKEALKLCLKIARILRTCWQDYGIVHRAIKPANILVDEAGEVYLLDVGNSKQLLLCDQVSWERLDNQGTLADFMSPEQAEGKFDLDSSTDIYSLGATLFFLLTGTKPYTGTDTTQVLLKHLNAPPPNPLKRPGDVSEDTAKLIRGMMDCNAEKRIYSWREVVSRIKQLLKSKTHGSGTEATLRTQLQPAPDWDEMEGQLQTPKKRGLPLPIILFIAVATILLIGLFGAIAIYVRNSQNPTPLQPTGQPTPTAKPRRRYRDDVLASTIRIIHKNARKRPAQLDNYIARMERLLDNTDDPEQIKLINENIAKIKQKKAEYEAFIRGEPLPKKDEKKKDDDNQEPGASVKPQLYRHFVMTGPLPGAPQKLWGQLGVKNGKPNLKASIKHTDGTSTWKEQYQHSRSEAIDFNKLYPSQNNNRDRHIYLYAVITAEKGDSEARIEVSHDDELTIWINGRKQYSNNRVVEPRQKKSLTVNLWRGKNFLLMRCRNVTHDWLLGFAIGGDGIQVNAPTT